MRRDKLTDRSRVLEYQRCHRARWCGYEYRDRGVASNRISIPLAVGAAVHVGLAALLAGKSVDPAVHEAQFAFAEIVSSRGLDVDALVEGYELQAELSYAFAENRALVEATVRMYVATRLNDLLAQFKVLQVERELTRSLGKPAQIRSGVQAARQLYSVERVPVLFMSRPDAVLLNRNNNEIEIMSYKTIGSWDYRKQAEAAHDTQGLSESWAVEGWLQQQWDCVRTNQTANRKRLASTESCSRC